MCAGRWGAEVGKTLLGFGPSRFGPVVGLKCSGKDGFPDGPLQFFVDEHLLKDFPIPGLSLLHDGNKDVRERGGKLLKRQV